MKAVVLAGGGGTRLYPLSTIENPKQFLKLVSDKPMIVDTILRLNGLCKNEDIVVVTNTMYEQKTKDILEEYGLRGVNIIAETDRRNTAPAITLSIVYCLEILQSSEDEAILIFPSDQAISPPEKFREAINDCIKIIDDGSIATIGITPTSPDTGYGYIKTREKGIISKAEAFKEKPDRETAEKYFESGTYYWNSGIYGFSAKTFKQELQKTYPNLCAMLDKSFDENLLAYSTVDAISIDYAVSEKSYKVVVVPFDAKWSDLGSFESLNEFLRKL